ncbi:MAG: neutral zinc metallopeptidase, partial [Woeseiaceae bacterium]
MEWKGRRASDNVEDARGKRVVMGTAGIAALVKIVTRLFGWKGLMWMVGIGAVGWAFGIVDPAALLGGGQVREVEYRPTAEEEEQLQFVSVVLADTEDIWSAEFQRIGRQYDPPGLVFYKGQYPTGCGIGDARMGPFYCPLDR